MATEARQLVRFLFLRLDAAWRRLPADEQVAHKAEFGGAVHGFRAKLLLRSYSLVGTRGDADLLLWQVAEYLEAFQGLETALFSTRLGAYLSIAHSFLGSIRRSIYAFPPPSDRAARVAAFPQESRYLFVYPFVKTREWYALPRERRQAMMEEHVRIGRTHPSIRTNTAYSFGLDDQEFILAFEGDDPNEFIDLVMELRGSEASAYTLRDTPTFTCMQMSLWEALDALGGAARVEPAAPPDGDGDGFLAVAATSDIPVGTGKRVYFGTEAVAVFNVGGRYYAVNDRCPHGRASLSEGSVQPHTCILTCPWHGGTFDVANGTPTGGPVRAPIRTYRVKVDGEKIFVG